MEDVHGWMVSCIRFEERKEEHDRCLSLLSE